MATPTPVPSGSVDFGRSFTFLTEDPEWIKKVLLGGLFVLLCAVLVGIPFLLGYWGRTLKRAVAGDRPPLPDWDDLGGLFSEGLPLLGVYLVYTLGILAAVAALGCVILIPLGALGQLAHARRGPEVVLGALGGLGMLALYAFIMVVSLALAVYLPAALVRTAVRGSVSDGLDWRANLAFIRANLGNYALSLVIYLIAAFVAQFGIILCCVGVFPATFWSYSVLAVTLGEAVRLNPRSVY
jgi:hypothetical protein